ncbi:Formyltetrahydrofolate deformylase [Poriferisphaera corsica]|uniref:Formyltetrahydrofolate deformylase n=1 Tax=Poriferisphaera corsica TaxID=2528020 RepID=A0A517YRE1_9BACT|nr:formyltetrahydrofolate deformylase [Poriferisphaera corsica]QDU32797.1 Formyltetrahydrofolate deformylase [Poriferisphaera corsica]
MPTIKAVINVIGSDQKGVVARFATYVAEKDINILDIEQQVVNGKFIMDMLVDLAEMSLSLDQLITEMLELGKEIDMQVRVTFHDQRRRKRVAAMVTKEAHCLDQMISDWKTGKYRGDIVCVLGNHPDLESVAKDAGLPFHWLSSKDKPAHFKWIMEKLAEYDIDLVALARYMQIIPPEMVKKYSNRIINIHPSLLPYFPGAKPYHQAWERGVRVTGCTAHFVTEDLDEGPTILQDVFHINVGNDTAEDVREKGQKLEGNVLSNAVQMYLDEKLLPFENKVVFRPGLSRFLDHAED